MWLCIMAIIVILVCGATLNVYVWVDYANDKSSSSSSSSSSEDCDDCLDWYAAEVCSRVFEWCLVRERARVCVNVSVCMSECGVKNGGEGSAMCHSTYGQCGIVTN